MIKFIFKYGLVIYLFNTLLISIEFTRSFGNQIFLVLMAVYGLLILISPQQIKDVIFHKAFSFFLILNILNVFYFLIFHSINDMDAIKYLLARGVQFSSISFAIYFNFDYYRVKFLNHTLLAILCIVFTSFIFDIDLFSGRYSGVVWNANMLASLTSIAFAVLFLKENKKTAFEIFLLVILLLVSLATGSRGVLLSFALVFLIKYGFSNRNLFYAFLAFFSYIMIINFQLDTSVNRFATQSLFNDRILQYKYALESILEKMYTGYGLDKYAYIDKSLVPLFLKGTVMGAHNGYLAILTQYGIVFGSVVLFIIFNKCTQVINYFRNSFNTERTYMFIIIYGLFASVYETIITGINEFHTILFWFALAFLSFSKFRSEHEK